MRRRRIITLIVILAIAGITVLFTRIELQGVKSKLKLEMEKPPKIEYRDVFVLTTPAVTLKHETLAYVKTFESEVTMYTLGYSSCQKKPNHQQYGQVAASGTVYAGLHPMYVRPRHTIAMDKSIPFGTFVKIDGFDEIFVVEDRGPAITGNDIDIYIESEKDAMEFGRQKRKVWILKYGESEGVVDMTEIIITTDGSVSGNGKPDAVGGWACILQAYRESLDTECSKCGYKGKLDEFEDTEYDGDVWGTCPKCHINCMIFIEEKKLIAEKEYSGKLVYETDSCPITNNRAEMYAILKGLESVTWKNCRIEVHSDSELCIKTLNGEYSRKTNQDLWERLDNRCMELKNRGCSIMFMWVRGHSAHVLNNRADKLAGKAKRS